MGTLHLAPVDWTIVAIYFAAVLSIGLFVRRAITSSGDFFLSGRSLPAWMTGLGFIGANLGALEILGNAANGAQYGLGAVHFFLLGAIPAMVFLGVVLMPFYYSTRVHSVPEYLRRRFNPATHVLNALIFAVAQVLLAGVNLFALGLIIKTLVGWPLWVSILVSAAIVLVYITLGGLTGAIYGEVLQFFVIVAGLVPLVVIGLHHVGGWSGLKAHVDNAQFFDTWQQTGVGHPKNPLGDWIGLVLGEGFVLSFGYWTTNFAEVQRTLAAKDLTAARRTPLIGAIPKMLFPLLTILPGMLAVAIIPKIGTPGGPTYNDAIPQLIERFLPSGVVGVALTGLLAAFMAGMAANVSGFNTVFTYDIWKPYIAKARSDRYYLTSGRIATVVGIALSVGTAFIASGYSNIQNYIQLLFGFFNSPLFAVFIIGLLWKRTSAWGAFWGMLAGTASAAAFHLGAYNIAYFYPGGVYDPTHATIRAQMANFYGAMVAFGATAVVTVLVTLVTKPRPISELAGLVWGTKDPNAPDDPPTHKHWWSAPAFLGAVIIAVAVVFSILLVLAKNWG
jgi:solute:Na+ symporter, SSS family